MPTVDLTLPHHRYVIQIEAGLLPRLGELVRDVARHDLATLIVDEAIAKSHGRVAARALAAAGYDTQVGLMPSGEQHKTLGTVRSLYELMLNHKRERRSPLIALGGGVTGDTAGFVAATYLRGVPLIQCPTTLLAMVDASVGGKVGVNVPQGKNLIGAFYQPHAVFIDVETLRTLPDREVRCGLAECVKHAIIRDAELFTWIEQHADDLLQLDTATLIELVERNVRIKAAVVMADEKESGERAHLNFGHTFAHAIESALSYGTYEHGEAVALGMVAATALAVEQRRCETDLLDRLVALLTRLGLPTSTTKLPAADEMIARMRTDKKVADGQIRLVLPDYLGQVSTVSDVPKEAIEAAWDALRTEWK